MSTIGLPIQPPVKLPPITDYNQWGMEPPKPLGLIEGDRPPSMKDMQLPSQGKLDLTLSKLVC